MSVSSHAEARQGVLATLISLPLAAGISAAVLMMTGYMM